MTRDRYLAMLGGELLFQSRSDDRILYEFVLKGSATGCLLMVKAFGEGRYWVTFAGGRSPEQAIDKFLTSVREGKVIWRIDKYRSTIDEKSPSR